MAWYQAIFPEYPAAAQIFLTDSVWYSLRRRSTSSKRRCVVVHEPSAKMLSTGRALTLFSLLSSWARLYTLRSPFLIAVVGPLALFIGQMSVRLHRGNNAGMAESLLDKFPVYGFTVLQVGASESSCVG